VDAYRQKRIIASVFREIPFSFFDCPRLPNGQINNPPQIFIDGDSAAGVVVQIVAGQTVSIPFQAQDLDFFEWNSRTAVDHCGTGRIHVLKKLANRKFLLL
jgi:hypothetical protein